MASIQAIATGSVKYPKPTDRTFQYGTAGVSSLENPNNPHHFG